MPSRPASAPGPSPLPRSSTARSWRSTARRCAARLTADGRRGRCQGPLHLVSAWASEQGLGLGQREVDGKSTEITAIPALLETLSVKNGIVPLDAMGCQKTIAGRILERHADYLLVLKANQGTAFRAVRACCEQHCFARGATGRPVFDAFDDSHGGLVRRRVFVCPEATSLEALRAWPGLRTVLAVETIRGVNGSGRFCQGSRHCPWLTGLGRV